MIFKIAKITLGLFIVMSFINTGLVSAKESKVDPAAAVVAKPKSEDAVKETVKVTFKEATGVISSLSNNFIAVVTGVDSLTQAGTEYAFNLDKKVKIEHKQSLKDIKVGDTVKVGYEETVKMLDGKRLSRSTAVKAITFLKAGPKEQVIQEPAPQVEQQQEEPSASEGNEPESGSLTLKGLKGR
jgi:hypothetical protein